MNINSNIFLNINRVRFFNAIDYGITNVFFVLLNVKKFKSYLNANNFMLNLKKKVKNNLITQINCFLLISKAKITVL